MSLQNLFGDLSLEETNKTILYLLAKICDMLPRTDVADRMAVNVETGSISVSSLPTLANVTTVASTTNLVNIGNQSAHYLPHNLSMPAYIYNNIVVS